MVLPKRFTVPNVQPLGANASPVRISEMWSFVRSSGAAAENLDGKVQPWPKLRDRMRASDRRERCRDAYATAGMYH